MDFQKIIWDLLWSFSCIKNKGGGDGLNLLFILPKTSPIISADNDPLFVGKTINNYDVVIYGHYHFYRYHKVINIEFYFLNGTGVAINNKSIYYVLETIDGKFNIS